MSHKEYRERKNKNYKAIEVRLQKQLDIYKMAHKMFRSKQ